jgi:hypothetical protein
MAIAGFDFMPRRKTRLIIESQNEYGTECQVADIQEYTLTEDFARDGYEFSTFISREAIERGKMANTYFANTTSSTNININYASGGWVLPKEDDMKTKVVEQAAGFVGTVLVSVNGNDVPVADTKAYKTKEKAEKAVQRLAIEHAKK